MPIPDADPGTWATIATGILGAIGLLWKSRLRARRDAREDSEEETIAKGYRKYVADLERRVNGLIEDMDQLRAANNEALARAWACESREAKLTARIGVLESQVSALQRGQDDFKP